MATIHRLERTQVIDRPLSQVFPLFANPANLEALTPRFLRFKILTPMPIDVRPGVQIEYALSLFGVPLRWRTRITEWVENVKFVDEQEAGPYALWRHTHTFEASGQSTIMRDVVEYSEPLGPLGWVAHHMFVERVVNRIFDFRREAIGPLIAAAASAKT